MHIYFTLPFVLSLRGTWLTFAHPLHHLPARPPPSGSLAARLHEPQLSPIKPMISIRDILQMKIHIRDLGPKNNNQRHLPESNKNTDKG